MKKIIGIILACFLLTGCYDNIELNNLAIITGLGIDYQDNEFYLTYEILNDSKTPEETVMKSYTISGQGSTLADAFVDANYKVGKKPYFAHLKIVLYSEALVKNHLDETLDYLLRDTNIRDEFIPLVCESVSPREVLEHNSDNIPVVSDFITNLIDNEKYNNNLAVNEVFQKFLAKIVDDNWDGILSSLTINDNDEITLSSFYTFKGYKMVNQLNELDSSLYNLLSQNTFSLNFAKNYQHKNVTISIIGSKSEIDVTKDKINITLELKGKVLENNANLDLKDQETYQMLNQDFGLIIQNHVTSFIKNLQKSQSDVLGFQDIYYKKYRKSNQELWLHADVNVNVNLHVNTKGFIFEVNP